MQHDVSFLHRNAVPPQVMNCKKTFPEPLEPLPPKVAACYSLCYSSALSLTRLLVTSASPQA